MASRKGVIENFIGSMWLILKLIINSFLFVYFCQYLKKKILIFHFFSKLEKAYDNNQEFLTGARVYNLAETLIPTLHHPEAILTQDTDHDGMKNNELYSYIENSKEALPVTVITSCCIVNALGEHIPPVMVITKLFLYF